MFLFGKSAGLFGFVSYFMTRSGEVGKTPKLGETPSGWNFSTFFFLRKKLVRLDRFEFFHPKSDLHILFFVKK